MGGEGLGERGKLRGLPAPSSGVGYDPIHHPNPPFEAGRNHCFGPETVPGLLNDNTSLASARASAEIGKYRKIQRLSGLPGEFGLIDSLSAGVFEELAVRLDNKPGIALRD